MTFKLFFYDFSLFCIISLSFTVTDTAGKTFTTGASDLTDGSGTTSYGRFHRPYYRYASTTESDYQSFTDYGIDNTAVLSVKLDTASPKIYTEGLSIEKTLADMAKVDAVKTSLEGNSYDYAISAKRFSGGDSKYIKLFIPVYDANLSAVTLSIADSTNGTVETTYSTVSGSTNSFIEGVLALKKTETNITSDGIEYTYYETDVIDVSKVNSGLKTITFTVTDSASNETKSAANFYVDNTGPETLTITSPSSTDEITGTTTITGTASDSGAGLATTEWLIPPKEYGETDAELNVLSGWTNSNNTGTDLIFKFKFQTGTTTD